MIVAAISAATLIQAGPISSAATGHPNGASASTTLTPVDTRRDGDHCVWLYGKSEAGKPSPLVDKACSDISPEAASAKLDAQQAQRAGTSAAPAGRVRIMIWYVDGNFNDYNPATGTTNGHRSDWIDGKDGPCDAAGYRIPTDSFWRDNLSSLVGDNNCHTARLTDKALVYAQDFRIDPYYAGNLQGYNDNVGLIHAHS
ncbi:hypothetical protein GCM10010174_48820 [Kutzneria viridogrisea]|uniref:hypothetical protein n=1 Tax=Kutzneria viridogrisea TaxID=47990 RepID=UPI0015FFD228